MSFDLRRCDLCGQAIRAPDDAVSLVLGLVPGQVWMDGVLPTAVVVVLHRSLCALAVWAKLVRALPPVARPVADRPAPPEASDHA